MDKITQKWLKNLEKKFSYSSYIRIKNLEHKKSIKESYKAPILFDNIYHGFEEIVSGLSKIFLLNDE